MSSFKNNKTAYKKILIIRDLFFKFRSLYTSCCRDARIRENYYEILGVKSSSSQKEIRAAYLDLCKKHHPDKIGSNDGSRFQSISEAYNCLSKVGDRSKYDLDLRNHNYSAQYASSRAAHANNFYRRPPPDYYQNYEKFYQMHYGYNHSGQGRPPTQNDLKIFGPALVMSTLFFLVVVTVLQVYNMNLTEQISQSRSERRMIEIATIYSKSFRSGLLDIEWKNKPLTMQNFTYTKENNHDDSTSKAFDEN